MTVILSFPLFVFAKQNKHFALTLKNAHKHTSRSVSREMYATTTTLTLSFLYVLVPFCHIFTQHIVRLLSHTRWGLFNIIKAQQTQTTRNLPSGSPEQSLLFHIFVMPTRLLHICHTMHTNILYTCPCYIYIYAYMYIERIRVASVCM